MKVNREYVNSVAGYDVSEKEAKEFLQGLEEFNTTPIMVRFDIDEDGFLITKTTSFTTMKEAMDFIRQMNHQTLIRPTIE